MVEGAREADRSGSPHCAGVTMAGAPAPKPRLRELDALRGIAALAVVVYHYSTRYAEMFPAAHHIPFRLAIGHHAVLLFFAISGFVIAFSLEGSARLPDFAVKRFARLYPAYWGAMLLTLAVEYWGQIAVLDVSPADIAANVTMLESFAFLPTVDGVYWTLSLELGFYVCMAALWRVGAMRRIEPVLLGWLALAWLASGWQGMPTRLIMVLVLDYIPFFAIGILAYRVWSGKRRWRDQAPYVLALLMTAGWLDGVETLGAALLLIGLFAALLAGKLRFLCTPPLLWLGTVSYSLYLVHHNIGFTIMLRADAAGWSPWMGCAAAVAVALCLAWLLNRAVEQPAARLIGDRWKRDRKSVV